MALATGTRIGTYEVVALIGAGGMGEVYRAHDTRLNRDVALKVLPEVFARDGQRMARFEREARVLASLNHPNIAAIYGLEESGATRALVMELVEGPTLGERIASGAIPLDEALPIVRQVADAVEYAHDNNVIHRDLKPANIKVKADGMVKVLDFGLAKALSDEPTEADMSNSPTLSMAATMQGVILGTAAYMSPEQAKGKKVDRRADVWAFGVVLYEMLTGKQLYKGETVSETMAAVMMKEPALDLLPSKTSPAIRKLLRRCLDKDPRQRLRDMGEARIVIHDTLSGTEPAESAATASARSGALSRPALLLSMGTLLVGALVSGIAIWNLQPAPASPPVTRTVINLPPGDQLAALDQPAVAISPDGSQVAYVATRGNVQQLFLRPMDGLEARPIAGTEGAVNPFFSPDGQWLGFVADTVMKKVSVSGGAAITLGDAGLSRGASWGSQGTIVFSHGGATTLRQMPDAGGASQPLTRVEAGETSHRWPEFLPGGSAVFFIGGANSNPRVAVHSIASGERRDLIEGGTSPRYASSGHLVYAQAGNLMAVPFDAQRLQVTGAAVPVVEGVQSGLTGATQYSVSETGSLVYVPGSAQGAKNSLVWVSRNGAEQLLAAPVRAYESPRLSPDGRRLAVSAEGHLWIYDFSRGVLTRFTFEGTTNNRPVWTPDAKRIAFYSNKEGPLNIFWQMADGSGGLERLTTSPNTHVPHSWSPDGQLLAFQDINPTAGQDTWILRLNDRKAEQFLQTPFRKAIPRFSPDGRWLAYVSDQSGREEIYVRPYPGPGGQWQVSTEGGTEPVWNSNGRELFYRNGDKMMAVEITTQPGFSAGNPEMLFEKQYASVLVRVPNYDVSPDGQRFLMIKGSEQAAPVTQINVVLNWTEELKRRAPAGTK